MVFIFQFQRWSLYLRKAVAQNGIEGDVLVGSIKEFDAVSTKVLEKLIESLSSRFEESRLDTATKLASPQTWPPRGVYIAGEIILQTSLIDTSKCINTL